MKIQTVMHCILFARLILGRAKDIIVKVIPSKVANPFVKKYHYSGKIVNNSKLHFGAFLDNRLHGVMSFGSPLDKRKVLGLVEGTKWNEMLELNRLAFADYLPKNSESRCISVAIKLIKKNAPHIKWILSFADGTQCGDGAIYRASGFVLTSIKKNTQIWVAPDGEIETRMVLKDTRRPKRSENLKKVFSRTSLTDGRSKQQQQQDALTICRHTMTKGSNVLETGGASMKVFKDSGFKPLEGYQLRYIYLIDKSCKLTVPILPFSEIDKHNARMYKGKRLTSIDGDATDLSNQEKRVQVPV